MVANAVSPAVQNFDLLPNQALLSMTDTSAISGRSRASLYRHFTAGELTPVKVGGSTRIRVSELRSLMGVQL